MAGILDKILNVDGRRLKEIEKKIKPVLDLEDKYAAMSDEELQSLKTRVLNEDTTSFGLTSAYKRLKILYGEDCSFNIESVPQEGTSISIEMPGKADIDDETIL